MDRISTGDLTQLASDVGPVPMNVGAVVVMDGSNGLDLDTMEALLGHRAGALPRLGQRLRDVPWGCGRPVWLDDGDFDVRSHISRVRLPAPFGRAQLLEAAVAEVTRELPRTRPLWRAVFLTGAADHDVALVLVMHHVLADGIGGLAVLARLVDGGGTSADDTPLPRGTAPTQVMPRRGRLLLLATADRVRALGRLPRALALAGTALSEMGSGVGLAPRCSLNAAPTGPRRRVMTTSVQVEAVREAAHRHGATINDVLLTVAAGALADLLRRRGESLPALVVPVPVAGRRATASDRLGNEGGVMPVRVPLTGSPQERLRQVRDLTAARKASVRKSSASVVGPLFRLLSALHLYRVVVDRQRFVNTFLTDLTGPANALAFGGVRIEEIVPVTVTAGNVSVAFAALSYRGRLTISVVVDPDLVPDPSLLTHALDAGIAGLRSDRERAQS